MTSRANANYRKKAFHQSFKAVIGTTYTPSFFRYVALDRPQRTHRKQGPLPVPEHSSIFSDFYQALCSIINLVRS